MALDERVDLRQVVLIHHGVDQDERSVALVSDAGDLLLPALLAALVGPPLWMKRGPAVDARADLSELWHAPEI